jgi:hypothetical protein
MDANVNMTERGRVAGVFEKRQLTVTTCDVMRSLHRIFSAGFSESSIPMNLDLFDTT